MITFLFTMFAVLAVGGAIGMISSRRPVASLLFLVLSFFSLAGIYVLLNAQFIAAVQVIVYAGAIMVLFLFVIMLLNLGAEFHTDLRHVGWVVAGLVAAGIIGWIISSSLTQPVLLASGAEGALLDASVRDQGVVETVAFPLFRDFAVPFEVTSLLLLVAAIGAVLLAKRRV